ncbi:hypothetical protein HDU76_001671 [Blyttiomyces sp. JEL0837]|nr:hypothetical protein HDU76_001671 [Blyttiomyces sp. JEL0837]
MTTSSPGSKSSSSWQGFIKLSIAPKSWGLKVAVGDWFSSPWIRLFDLEDSNGGGKAKRELTLLRSPVKIVDSRQTLADLLAPKLRVLQSVATTVVKGYVDQTTADYGPFFKSIRNNLPSSRTAFSQFSQFSSHKKPSIKELAPSVKCIKSSSSTQHGPLSADVGLLLADYGHILGVVTKRLPYASTLLPTQPRTHLSITTADKLYNLQKFEYNELYKQLVSFDVRQLMADQGQRFAIVAQSLVFETSTTLQLHPYFKMASAQTLQSCLQSNKRFNEHVMFSQIHPSCSQIFDPVAKEFRPTTSTLCRFGQHYLSTKPSTEDLVKSFKALEHCHDIFFKMVSRLSEVYPLLTNYISLLKSYANNFKLRNAVLKNSPFNTSRDCFKVFNSFELYNRIMSEVANVATFCRTVLSSATNNNNNKFSRLISSFGAFQFGVISHPPHPLLQHDTWIRYRTARRRSCGLKVPNIFIKTRLFSRLQFAPFLAEYYKPYVIENTNRFQPLVALDSAMDSSVITQRSNKTSSKPNNKRKTQTTRTKRSSSSLSNQLARVATQLDAEIARDAVSVAAAAESNTPIDGQPRRQHGKPSKVRGTPTAVTLGDFDKASTVNIGYGAYGTVYKVTGVSSKRSFGLKRTPKSFTENHFSDARNEFAVMKSLNYKYIVKLFAAFGDASNLYLLMEFIEGGNLAERIKNSENGLAFHYVVGITAQIMSGLKYLHQMKKVIHRDLKPDNIMFTKEGHVKLVDFGLSANPKDTNHSGTCGNEEYMAPEMYDHGRQHTSAVDIWSLGIIIFEMIYKQKPFNENDLKVFEDIIKADVTSPSDPTGIKSEWPIESPPPRFPVAPRFNDSDVKALITYLLTWDPKDRLDTYKTVIRSLDFFKGVKWEDVERGISKPVQCIAEEKDAENDSLGGSPLMSEVEDLFAGDGNGCDGKEASDEELYGEFRFVCKTLGPV